MPCRTLTLVVSPCPLTGAHDPAYAPNISQIQYTSVIPDSDSVHRNWRVYVTDLSVDYNGQRAAIPVGYSSLASSGGYPLAVLDTGGTYNLGPVNVLNALYGVWGIGPGQDGGYYGE